MNCCKQFINGDWVDGEGENFASYEKTNLEILWEGKFASASQIDAAIRAARIALWDWKKLNYLERFKYLKEFAEIISKNRQELKEAISKETGKPLWEADLEVQSVIDKISVSKLAYEERCFEKAQTKSGISSIVKHKPHGVIAVFGPFNLPAHVPNGQIVPALLAGNTVVFKPSENTPYVGEMLVSFWEKAGLPKGVLNLVQGAKDVGKNLAEHSDLDGIFFVGSAAVGMQIGESVIKYPNRIIALEMGGNNSLIVDEVENLDAAVYTVIQSAFITSGQRCTCARRLIVTETEKNKQFLEKLIAAIKKIKAGSYLLEPEPFMGPVISNAAASKIIELVQELINDGAKALVPLNRLDQKLPLLSPALIDVTNINKRIDEEIFGPVLKLTLVKDLEEAIVESNCTSYGLSAGILTDKKENYDLFYQRIRAGVVSWNRPLTFTNINAPFGGVGKSGNHRPSGYYAADYCAYPVACMESKKLSLPKDLFSGIEI